MNKPLCIIQAPLETRSGYGDMARDIASHFIEMNKFEVRIVSTPWGNTPMNALDANNPRHMEIIKRIIKPPVQLSKQPEVYVQITVPNEFQRIGKFNIGITAGIETTACSLPWIEGCNKMDVIWTISEHSKRVFDMTVVEMKNQTGQTVQTLKVTKPVSVLHNCVHTDIFVGESTKILESIDDVLLNVKEKFAFLFVGHWLRGDLGHDRKNVGALVKVFCETFKNTISSKQPALILKTSGAGFSILDREDILNKIKSIRDSIGNNCPKVYLLHGELTDEEMNSLYNHPKVKAHINLTHGEGFGRPMLEATTSEKPLIASGWSGQLDFLNKDEAILISGKLENVHPSSVWENVIIPESQWFIPDYNMAASAMLHVVNNYETLLPKARSLAKKNREHFSYEAIFKKTIDLVEKQVPTFEMEVPLKLPTLKKVT